ncbi:MAG: hypothetical protein HOW73_43300 [Polyangiaceae bacterium]|nr:hypothetical protein [Polyangiaceae bacterium]
MGKTITLKGDAAKAFLGIKLGAKTSTEDDHYAQCAVAVALAVKSNDMAAATELLRSLVKNRGGTP